MTEGIAALFAAAGCAGQVWARSLGSKAEGGVGADEPVVPASVIKVLVAVAAEAAFAAGAADPDERVTLAAASRTAGPVGFSLYRDDVEVSARDLVVPMLTISDNAATDALLERIGLDACNELAERLGMAGTRLASGIAAMVDSIGRDAGFSGWEALTDWLAADPPPEEVERVDARVRASGALDPRSGTRTTARDMCLLLDAIWSDSAAPPAACARVRALMARQLTRHRLAAGMPPGVGVWAKSGGLVGVVRNEVGVVRFPDGDAYAVAVFTRAAAGDERTINAAIGRAALMAVDGLRAGGAV